MNGFGFTPDDENVPAVDNRAGSVGCVLRTKRWRVRRTLRGTFTVKPAATINCLLIATRYDNWQLHLAPSLREKGHIT